MTSIMVKIKLIKNHVAGRVGDVIETTKDKANYLIRVGVATDFKGSVEEPNRKPKTVKKPTKKKDAKG